MKRYIVAMLGIGLCASSAPAHFGRLGRQARFGGHASPVLSSAYYVQPAVLLPAAPVCALPVAPLVVPALPPAPLPVQPLAPITVQPPVLPRQAPVPIPEQRPPQRRPPDMAVPESAPPSERGPIVPPARPAPGATRTTRLKPKTPYFSMLPDGGKPQGDLASCTVTFWNLSRAPLTVRASGTARNLPEGRSVTLPVTRDFAWQVNRRTEEVTRIPRDENATTILIRR